MNIKACFPTYRFVAVRGLFSVVMLSALFFTSGAASATAITFDSLSGNGGALFKSYAESGFTVSAISDRWAVNTLHGNPSPFILYNRQANEDTLTAGIKVIAAGSQFSFSSVDLYSSITEIPYVINGILNSTTVFTLSGTVPMTLGLFATVLNPNSTDIIDTLEIMLSNPSTPCCDNPVGLDNIVVTVASSIAEPGVLVLFALGLAGIGVAQAAGGNSTVRRI